MKALRGLLGMLVAALILAMLVAPAYAIGMPRSGRKASIAGKQKSTPSFSPPSTGILNPAAAPAAVVQQGVKKAGVGHGFGRRC